MKHKKPTKINVEVKPIDTNNEPIEIMNKDEPIEKTDIIIKVENDDDQYNSTIPTSNLMNHIKQPVQQPQEKHIMNIPLKLKEKILRSKLTRINEFILSEVSTDPLYLDILADEYKYNLSSTLGASEFVKFLELYFGRYF